MWTRTTAYLRGILTRRRATAEAADELQFHLEHEIAANVARGLSPAEARRIALRDLGGLAQTTEAVREVRTMWLDGLGRDVRYALRRFRREPGFVAAAVATLAVGIGACTAMYSVVQAVLLRPIGVHDTGRVVMMWPEHEGDVGEMPFNMHLRMRERLRSFDEVAIAGSVNWSATVTLPGTDPFRVPYTAVSTTFFDVLGARPMLGRGFTPEDEDISAPRVLVLTHDSWTRRFGADPAVVGRLVAVDTGTPDSFQIIGVMPPDLFFPRGTEFWTPAGPNLAQFARKSGEAIEPLFEGLGVFFAVARLGRGVSIAEAQAEMGPFLTASAAEQGIEIDLSLYRIAMVPIVEHVFGRTRPALLVLMGTVLVVLVIACTNVGGLLLARGAARTREIAVRAALGATRRAIACQLLTESALLAMLGAVLGISVAGMSLDLVIALSPAHIPRLDAVTLDTGVVLFAIALTSLSALILGALPAWQISRPALVRDIRGASMGLADRSHHTRNRSALVGFQIAATLVLLAAAGLCVQSFARLTRLDLGFDPANVLTFAVRGLDGKNADGVEQVLSQIRHTPHVTAVGAISQRPFENGPIGWDTSFLVEGQADNHESWSRNPMLNFQTVTGGYLDAMDVRLTQGRHFQPTDNENAPGVAIVSEATARRVWPGLNPIGKRLRVSLLDDGTSHGWLTIVGIVPTARYREIDSPRLDLYVPLQQSNVGVQHFMVRTDIDPAAVAPALRAAIADEDKDFTIDGVMTMAQIVQRTQAPWRFNMLVFSLFGSVALVLAAIGLFGLVAYAVSQRTHEIGVRMALGASPANVVRLMLSQGARPAAVGLIAGLVTASLTTRLLSNLLFDIGPADPATFASAAGVLTLVSALATYLPSRRAAAVNPLIALREE